MEKYGGFLFAKLDRIGTKMEGPEYFLQQWDKQRKTTDTHIQKQVEAWKIDPRLHNCLARKVIISGTIKDKSIQYKEITLEKKKDVNQFEELPIAEAYRLIDFGVAEVHGGFVPKTYILVVSGTKPYINMEVTLKPLVYIRRPEYWGIQVVGSLHGIGILELDPYTASIPLGGIMGTKGIEVIGATHAEKKDVPPKRLA